MGVDCRVPKGTTGVFSTNSVAGATNTCTKPPLALKFVGDLPTTIRRLPTRFCKFFASGPRGTLRRPTIPISAWSYKFKIIRDCALSPLAGDICPVSLRSSTAGAVLPGPSEAATFHHSHYKIPSTTPMKHPSRFAAFKIPPQGAYCQTLLTFQPPVQRGDKRRAGAIIGKSRLQGDFFANVT